MSVCTSLFTYVVEIIGMALAISYAALQLRDIPRRPGIHRRCTAHVHLCAPLTTALLLLSNEGSHVFEECAHIPMQYDDLMVISIDLRTRRNRTIRYHVFPIEYIR